MECRKCGQVIDDEAVICVHCGVAQKVVVDNGGFGYSLLGCCIPVVGLVLYFILKDKKPNTAGSIGKGLLIYGIFFIVYMIIASIVSLVEIGDGIWVFI